MSQCDGSTISLNGMFDQEDEDRAEMAASITTTKKKSQDTSALMGVDPMEAASLSTTVEEMLAIGSRLLQLTTFTSDEGPVEAEKPPVTMEQTSLSKGWNTCAFSGVVPQNFSWTGRSQYAEKGLMEDGLPLHPSISENVVEKDGVDQTLIPKHVPIHLLNKNVFSQATKSTEDAPAEPPAKNDRDEHIAAMHSELKWIRAALSATSSHASVKPVTSVKDSSDEQLSKLRVELAKVKETLLASTHAPHAKEEDNHAIAADQWNQRNDEVTTTSETEAEQSRMKHARTLVSETSQTEYDTSLENPKRTYIGKDGRVHQRRRKSRTESSSFQTSIANDYKR